MSDIDLLFAYPIIFAGVLIDRGMSIVQVDRSGHPQFLLSTRRMLPTRTHKCRCQATYISKDVLLMSFAYGKEDELGDIHAHLHMFIFAS